MIFILNKGLSEERNMTSKTNEDADFSNVLNTFFDVKFFEYMKIRMRKHLKVDGWLTLIENGIEYPKNDGKLLTTR